MKEERVKKESDREKGGQEKERKERGYVRAGNRKE